MAFHKCKKRNRLGLWRQTVRARRSAGAVEAVWMARGVHPYRRNRQNVFGWVVSLSQQVQRDVAQRKVLSYLRPIRSSISSCSAAGRTARPRASSIRSSSGTSRAARASSASRAAIRAGKSFKGVLSISSWFDEEPPKDIYEECLMRVFDRRGDIFGTMTPLKGLTFLYDEIYLNKKNNPEVWYEFMEWADNPYLSKREIALWSARWTSLLSLPAVSGGFRRARGSSIPNSTRACTSSSPLKSPRTGRIRSPSTPGSRTASPAHWYAADFDGNVYVVAEHYKAGEDVDYHARRIHEISSALGWKQDASGRVRALIDSAAGPAHARLAEERFRALLRAGILVDARVNKELFSGIARVKSYLKRGNGQPDLFIFSCCTHLIRELKGYFWGKGDVPEKKDDHALDELRYYLMSRPHRTETKTVSDVQREKERLLRALRKKPRPQVEGQGGQAVG